MTARCSRTISRPKAVIYSGCIFSGESRGEVALICVGRGHHQGVATTIKEIRKAYITRAIGRGAHGVSLGKVDGVIGGGCRFCA